MQSTITVQWQSVWVPIFISLPSVHGPSLEELMNATFWRVHLAHNLRRYIDYAKLVKGRQKRR